MTHTEYANKWKVAMKEAYSLALKNKFKSAMDGKRHYDHKVRFSNLQPGDRVLVRNLSERGWPGKLRSYWERKIHVVREKKATSSLQILRSSCRGQSKRGGAHLFVQGSTKREVTNLTIMRATVAMKRIYLAWYPEIWTHYHFQHQ